MSARAPSPSFLWVLFFGTGLSGLLLEQSFERWLSTVVGASRQSGAIVLALYFVGLALGARLFGPLSRRVRDGVRLYGLLEGAVGLYAMLLAYLPEPLLEASTRLVAAAPAGSAAATGVRILVGALWILPPTLAMGATFPAVVRALEQRGDHARLSSQMSSLYGANLLGAVTAAFLAPYLFFAYLGVNGTLQVVVAIQVAIVGTVLWRSQGQDPGPGLDDDDGPGPRPAPDDGGRSGRAVVLLAFVSGAVVFSFEVLWIHLIGAAIGMSAFSFSLMLVCVLLGLGLASAVVAKIRPAGPALPDAALGGAFAAAAVVCLASLQLWDVTGDILLWFGDGATTFAAGEWARFATAAVVLLPCAVALGITYPLLFRVERFPRARAAVVSSHMAAANALGSMVGALGTGFVLLNTLGAEWTMRGLVAVLAGAGALLLIGPARASTARDPKLLLALCAGLVLLPWLTPRWDLPRLLSGVNVYFAPSHANPDDKIVYLAEDNVSGFTTVVRRAGTPERPPLLTLLTNGKFQGNDGGEVTAQLGFAYLPAAYAHGRRRALVIGLGTGASAAAIHAAGFRAVDVAELSPHMPEAARRFGHINRNLLDLEGVTLFVEDGRTHLTRSPPGHYDVMSLELSSVWFAGTTNLYSRDFYRLAKDRLAEGGVLQQWVQLHHIGTGELLSIVSTLRDVFTHVQLHFVGGQGILLASERPLVLDPAHAADTAEQLTAAFANVPRAGRLLDPRMVEGTRVLDDAAATRLWAYVKDNGLILNDDLNRYLEFWSPRYNLERRDHVRINLRRLLQFADAPTRDTLTARYGLAPDDG